MSFTSLIGIAIAVGTSLTTIGVHAQQSGLAGEIKRFVMQIEEASPNVADAMTAMQAEYTSGAATLGDRTYDFTAGTDKSHKQNPIATIKYSYVDDYSNAFHVVAGADNSRMYVMEVTFKTTSQYADIHPSLAGKTVMFVANGIGPLHTTIYTNQSGGSNVQGTANLATHDLMSRIGGFSCKLKANRCTSSAGSDPVKTCEATAAVNGGVAPGLIVTSSNNINLFYYVSGPFSLCADQNSLKDSMGA